jgi:hypothetical protein
MKMLCAGVFAGSLLALTCTFTGSALAQQEKPNGGAAPGVGTAAAPQFESWKEQYAYSVGVQAYIYAFPLLYLTQLCHKWATDATSSPYAALNHFYLFGTIKLLLSGKKLGEGRVEKTAGFKYSLYEGAGYRRGQRFTGRFRLHAPPSSSPAGLKR